MAERSLKQMGSYLPEDTVAQFQNAIAQHMDYLNSNPNDMLTEDVKSTIRELEKLAQTIAETAFNAMS